MATKRKRVKRWQERRRVMRRLPQSIKDEQQYEVLKARWRVLKGTAGYIARDKAQRIRKLLDKWEKTHGVTSPMEKEKKPTPTPAQQHVADGLTKPRPTMAEPQYFAVRIHVTAAGIGGIYIPFMVRAANEGHAQNQVWQHVQTMLQPMCLGADVRKLDKEEAEGVLRRNNVQRLSFTDSRIANKLGDAKLGEGNVWQSMMTATFDKDTNKWSASYGDLFLAE
jgi:hypothetical protein